jgi:hypothetical protein
MNKILTTIILFLTSFTNIQAQAYKKFLTNSEYQNKKIKILKGEIVQYYNSTKPNKINVLFGQDTITDLDSKSKQFTEAKEINDSYIYLKDSLIKLKNNGMVAINVTSIPSNDTVTLYSETGKRITQLIDDREVDAKLSDLGKNFRLIISNAPSIFYNIDQLIKVEEPNPIPTPVTVKKENEWEWWYFALIALGISVLGIGIWKNINAKKEKSLNVDVFRGSSLKDFDDFIKKHGGIEELYLLNKTIIPSKNEWSSCNDDTKKNKIKKIKDKKISIPAEKEKLYGTQNNESDLQQTNIGNIKEISDQLKQLQTSLIQEIQKINSVKNNQNDISGLQKEITVLEKKLSDIQNEKISLIDKLSQIESEKDKIELNFKNANDEKNRVQNEITGLKEKVISVEFLKGYSESVFSYLKYCQHVSSDAYNFFNKINQTDPEQVLVTGQLLMKFHSNTLSIPIGNWIQITQDIKETSATTNRSLIYGISQFNSEEERKREFQRILFSEVITKYHSSILILAESFRNLERFNVSFELVRDSQKAFSEHVTTLLSKASAIGLETKYVPLFKNFEDYPGLGESVNQKVSVAYRAVQGLEKNSIAEILLYGWKIENGEEKTQFILA